MTNKLVERMLEQIERDYADVITLRTLSAGIGRQPAYLGRLFQQEVGSSFRDVLTRVRLEHAAELIRDGVKVEAVALSVGYRSKKNFYQRFKRHYGTTPVRYRTGPLAEKRSAPERQIAIEVSGGSGRSATVAPAHQFKDKAPTGSASEPVLSQMGSIIRASNRAWRLAVRAQEILLQRFTRLRLGILLTNDVGHYVGANRAAVLVTGYSMTDLYDLSPGDLFLSAPSVETRCVWQLVLTWPYRSNQSPNATVRTKAGDSVDVHLVTLRNLLWGRREMSAVLERTRPVFTE